ncbi:FAD binding domain-containing protein [Paenibacillus sp. GCM10023248]|uniref:FAD binding domain-containing protein n=1 Tax=Bacillales TaxID=1385 RepID=UPI00237825F5|nr:MULTISPECIES: FAD binding domain-containing protein [Bacillales]MDD9271406.1 FAD binding domain-containing protein [Paenibacillus sp. MAHUQ-63]MDR6884379.1 carbon-monoxide dehydrogenase medium subunit [Bacillus sp. 3255]
MSIPLHQLPEQQPAVWQPVSVEEAMQLKRQWGDASVLISGGTWLRTRWESGLAMLPKHLISLSRIPALSGLTIDASGQLHIGPALCLADLMEHPLISQRCGVLVQACAEIAAPSVRNLATIGGNVMTRTGDLIPVLLIMNAGLVWSDGYNERMLPLREWLEVQQAANNEVLTKIVVPSEEADDVLDSGSYAFYSKVGRREAFTPSVVTVAGKLQLEGDGTVTAIALSAGGGNAVPARFFELEEDIVGKRLSKAVLKTLHKGVSESFQAVADDYAGAAYRKLTAANLIVSECYKAWRKGGGADAPQS